MSTVKIIWFVLLTVLIITSYWWEFNNMTRPPKTAADRTRGDGRGPNIYHLQKFPEDTLAVSETKTKKLVETFTNFAIWRYCAFLSGICIIATYFITNQSLSVSQQYTLFITIYLISTSVVGFTRYHFYRPIQQHIYNHLDNIKLLSFSSATKEETRSIGKVQRNKTE